MTYFLHFFLTIPGILGSSSIYIFVHENKKNYHGLPHFSIFKILHIHYMVFQLPSDFDRSWDGRRTAVLHAQAITYAPRQ